MNRFFAGYLIALCIESLYQDFLGKEKYIAFISNNWIEPVYSVPIAIVGIIVAGFLFRNSKK